MTTRAEAPSRWEALAHHPRLDRDALRDVIPLLFALVPFALVVGVQAATDRRAAGAVAGSLLLFAGSAQVSTLSLMHQGAGLVPILVTVALINARFVAYTANLATRFAGQPTWFRVLAPHFVIDQTFAMATARADLTGGAKFRRYWLTSGLVFGVVWVTAMAAGATLGPVVPHAPAVALMPAAVFAGFLGPVLKDRASVAAVATGVVVALAPLPTPTRVLLGTASGAFAGFMTEKMTQR